MEYQQIEQLYSELVARHPHAERKGKSMPYTSVNGHMYSHLSKEGEMGIRLSPDDLIDFITKYNTTHHMQHGRVMKEYATVPLSLLQNTDEIFIYFEKSHAYTAILKPKSTKKK